MPSRKFLGAELRLHSEAAKMLTCAFLLLFQCLKQYVELLIKEGLETAISCPDAACPKQGHLQEDEARAHEQAGSLMALCARRSSCRPGFCPGLWCLLFSPSAYYTPRFYLLFFQIECMVAAEIMQRYKKLQFERGRWPSALTSYGACNNVGNAGGLL